MIMNPTLVFVLGYLTTMIITVLVLAYLITIRINFMVNCNFYGRNDGDRIHPDGGGR